MRIAIITAMAKESLPIYEKLGVAVAQNRIAGVDVCKLQFGEHSVFLATGGVGEIKAALTVQLLKDLFDVDVALNFGFVGALSDKLSVGELVLVNKVCHYQFDTSLIDNTQKGQYPEKEDIYFYLDGSLIDRVVSALRLPIKTVTAVSGDVFVGSTEQKQHLKECFGGEICEMELAGLAIACERNRLPLLSVKVVSDRADGGAAESFETVVEKGLGKYEKILPDILNAVAGDISPLPPVRK